MSVAGAKAYSAFARTLHWLTAVGVLSMIPAGIVMGQLKGGPLQNFLFDFHRSTGVVLFLVTVVRLGYRLARPPLPLPADVPGWQRTLSSAVHYSLYAILLVNPLLGWIATSAYPARITVFWLVELPPIVDKNRPFSEAVFEVHSMLGYLAATLVTLHVAAACYHHFIRRDKVLWRMITG